MTSQEPERNVLREWRESAEYWEKHALTIRAMFAPVTQALIEEAGIVEGDAVLDIAGGPGEPAITIAEFVGPTGSVTSTDAVAEMVEAAEREASRRGVANISFRKSTADALPFDDQSFDVVVCRLGVMFFPDVLAGVREMLRVTKPEGGIAFAVWGKSKDNPFLFVVTDIVSRHVEAAPADPNAPGAFRFADSGSLADVLNEAGARNVKERLLQFYIEAPINQRQFWEMRSQTPGTLREKLAQLPTGKADQIAQEVEQALGGFFPDNQMRFPAQMLIVGGTK